MPTLNIPSPDPTERLKRARRALDGLSIGDALGGVLSPARAHSRSLPAAPWYFTDDTMMALSIYSILRRFGKIDQDELARDFALHFIAERGYGPGMRRLLPAIGRGEPWKEVSRKLFGGSGSLGNGGAMRIAPLGAYFADDLTLVADQAHLATEITHCHPEGIAGGIAVAVGTAVAMRLAGAIPKPSRAEFIDLVLVHVPAGLTYNQIQKARDLSDGTPLADVVAALGNGSAITAIDTVPLCLWTVGEMFGNYADALWLIASAGGDKDTTAAITGGMAALSMPENDAHRIPAEWLSAREPLPSWAFTDDQQVK